MKMAVSKQVYDQFDDASRRGLRPVNCHCLADGKALLECDSCDGGGVIYEWELSLEDSEAIQDNLRRQGVPIGKIGTH